MDIRMPRVEDNMKNSEINYTVVNRRRQFKKNETRNTKLKNNKSIQLVPIVPILAPGLPWACPGLAEGLLRAWLALGWPMGWLAKAEIRPVY